MKSIQLLVEEHDNIKRMLKVGRQLALKVMNSGEVDFDSFYALIDFVRNYADSHHHSKEEEILFKRMREELGEPLASGPIAAMFSEHDLGRLYMHNLEEALAAVKDGDEEAKVDVIANTVSYTDLLYRHIEKEDETIYTYGEKNLSQQTLTEVEDQVTEIESEAQEHGVQNKYLKLIEELEAKYLEGC
ncbi:MAG: hemerythrin domain-containing protein [Bacillota bacterium]